MTIAKFEAQIKSYVADAGAEILPCVLAQARGEIRAVLPHDVVLRGEDSIRGGVGARLHAGVAQIRPYLYRLACSNGSLYQLGFASADISVNSPNFDPDLREAVTSCLEPALHKDLCDQMDSTHDIEVDITSAAMTLASYIAKLPSQMDVTMALIIEKFLAQKQRSLFAFVQAVTAVARDSKEDFERWELERLGGCLVHEGPQAMLHSGVRELSAIPSSSSFLGV